MTLRDLERSTGVVISEAINDEESEYKNYIAFTEDDNAIFLIVDPVTDEIIDYDDGK